MFIAIGHPLFNLYVSSYDKIKYVIQLIMHFIIINCDCIKYNEKARINFLLFFVWTGFNQN